MSLVALGICSLAMIAVGSALILRIERLKFLGITLFIFGGSGLGATIGIWIVAIIQGLFS